MLLQEAPGLELGQQDKMPVETEADRMPNQMLASSEVVAYVMKQHHAAEVAGKASVGKIAQEITLHHTKGQLSSGDPETTDGHGGGW